MPTTTPAICTWCEEAPAVRTGYDEHNGPWAECADCIPAEDGWACIDCTAYLANGELPADEAEAEEYLSRLTARHADGAVGDVTLGRLLGRDGCEHVDTDEEHAEECERRTFSWSPCDVCGSRLGGSRDAVTLWGQR